MASSLVKPLQYNKNLILESYFRRAGRCNSRRPAILPTFLFDHFWTLYHSEQQPSASLLCKSVVVYCSVIWRAYLTFRISSFTLVSHLGLELQILHKLKY